MVRGHGVMSLAVPWGGLACILIIAWTAHLTVSSTTIKCGFCQTFNNSDPCDTSRGWCLGGCQAGWYGPGCVQRCNGSTCLEVCNCSRVCEQCDTQSRTCVKDKCMDVANLAGKKPVDSEPDSTGVYVVVTCVGFAVVAFIVFATRRRSTSSDLTEDEVHSHTPSRGLRGVVLGHACCAWCPAFRDCLQWLGTTLHLPGFGLGAKDSLDTFGEEDEFQGLTYSAHMRMSRHHRQQGVVGVKTDAAPIRYTNYSGYKWKKKWRDRREKSKQKRKIKHQERKRIRDDDPNDVTRGRAGSILLPAIGTGLMGLGQSLQAGARRGSFYATSLFAKRGSVGQNPTVVGGHLSPSVSMSTSGSGGSLPRPTSPSPPPPPPPPPPPDKSPRTVKEEDASEAELAGGVEKKGSSHASLPALVLSPPAPPSPKQVGTVPPDSVPSTMGLISAVITGQDALCSGVSAVDPSSPADPIATPVAVTSSHSGNDAPLTKKSTT